MRQGLFEDGVKPQFAGHETFPLRLLWLKKAHDAVAGGAPLGTFVEQGAIATFGVGRNMAAAMRHWAGATGFVVEEGRSLRPSPLGDLILADEGLDPYLEAPATIWLAHWHVASTRLCCRTDGGDSAKESRGIDGRDAQACRPSLPYDELARV